MRKNIYLIAFVGLFILLAGCTVSYVGGYGDLEGYVGVPRGTMRSLSELSQEINPEDLVILSEALDLRYYTPLVDAEVRISGQRPLRTNAEGYFHATGLPTGRTQISITHQALRKRYIKEIKIERGLVNQVNFFEGGIGHYIVIGIEKYRYLDNAPGAKNDAISVANVFDYDTILAGHDVDLLLDEAATKYGIQAAIRRAVRAAEGNPNSYLVLYFAGLMGWDYLSPYDDNLDSYYEKAITDTQLEKWLGEFPGDVTVILDGTDSATFIDGKESLKEVPIRPLALGKPKYTVISSAGKGQKANVSTISGHGLFTHYLIAGLSTERRLADEKAPYGTITAEEIFNYIASGMDEYLTGMKDQGYTVEPQVPVLYPDYANTVILRY